MFFTILFTIPRRWCQPRSTWRMGRNWGPLTFYFIYLFLVCACKRVCIYKHVHRTCVEAREQCPWLDSLLPPCGFWTCNPVTWPAESSAGLEWLPKKLNIPTSVSEVLILGTRPKGTKSFLYRFVHECLMETILQNQKTTTSTKMSSSGERVVSYTGTTEYYSV